MAESRILGIPSPRVEGEEKVGGKAIYAGDVVFPGMLWVKALRSPVAHARIKRLETSRAAASPGVHVVMTGIDFGGARIGKKIVDMPVLAEEVVRFIGEKVAAVAAESEEAAERAIELIEVEYEELPVVTEAPQAMKPEAPLLHPKVAEYGGLLHKNETARKLFVP